MAKSIRDASKTIAVTSTIIAEEISDADMNPNAINYREIIYLYNTSTAGEIIYVSVDQEAVIGKGFVLNPGGFISLTMEGKYKPSSRRFNAIATVGTASLSIHEECQVN